MSAARYEMQGRKTVDYGKEVEKFQPTLFVGLGGTGKDILMRFRKRLYDDYGSCREGFVKYLAIDTDDQTNTPTGEPDELYKPVDLKREQGEFIKCTITPGEFTRTHQQRRNKDDHRYKWMHPELENIPVGALETGAGTIRQAGRLAFFLRYNEIREWISRHIKDMMAYAADKPTSVFNGIPGEVYTDRVEVVIITSLAGGTGAGMFIDLAYLIRDILEHDHDPVFRKQIKATHTTVIAILPTIYAKSDPNLSGRFKQNAYASLLEMEYYNTPRPADDPFMTQEEQDQVGDMQAVEFRVNWDKPQGKDRIIRSQAWDTCYLIDDVNDRQPAAAREHADLYQMVADYMFLDFGSNRFSIAKRSARSNHTQLRDRILNAHVFSQETQDEEQDDDERERGTNILYENKYGCTFGSFGLAEIFIDKERISRAAGYRLALNMIRQLWISDANRYSDNIYNDWAKEDLHSGTAPLGETQGISFHPDDMWQELLRGQGRDWLRDMRAQFDRIANTGLGEGPGKLRSALDAHREALATKAQADGLPGPARKTLNHRYAELAGNPNELGIMRRRLNTLLRQRFNRIGVEPTRRLLDLYRKNFELAAKWARNKGKAKLPTDHVLLARLSDAESVPFPCHNIATRIEFERACRKSRSAVEDRYAKEAAEYLDKLCNDLRTYVADDKGTMPIHKSLADQYSEIRTFLDDLVTRLSGRFDETQRNATSDDRKRPLMPDWSGQQFDAEINKALLKHADIGQGRERGKFNWQSAEKTIVDALVDEEAGKSMTLADLLDVWMAAYQRNKSSLNDIADRIAVACRHVLAVGGGIDLTQFKNGNVVDYLVAMEDRQADDLLEKLVDASASYLPSIAGMDLELSPAYRNILGITGGKGAEADTNRDSLATRIEGIAIKDSGAFDRDRIHSKEEGSESALVQVREMGGVPLHYYGRLEELKEAYFEEALLDKRKTCHIKFRETFEDLPDIELIGDEQYRYVRDYVTDVLRGILLRAVVLDNDGVFVVKVPDLDGDLGSYTIRLGCRINRIIKHACERQDIRRYLQKRWDIWQKDATATHMAVMYNAIQQTLQAFPKVVTIGKEKKPPAIRNCYRKLLKITEKDLLRQPDGGQEWYELLRLRHHELDADHDEWKPRYDKISEQIRTTCLNPASEELPLLQINDRKISEIHFPS